MIPYDEFLTSRDRRVICVFDEDTAERIVALIHDVASFVDNAFWNQRRAVRDDDALNRELVVLERDLDRCRGLAGV